MAVVLGQGLRLVGRGKKWRLPGEQTGERGACQHRVWSAEHVVLYLCQCAQA